MKSVLLIKMFLGLVEMTFGVVYASFSFPEWQAFKMTFFAPGISYVSEFWWACYLKGEGWVGRWVGGLQAELKEKCCKIIA